MTTAPVTATVSGVSFSVDTSVANLDSTLTIRDFLVLENGTLTLNPLSYTKTTPTSISYSGPALAASTTLEIRRNTPREQRVTVLPNTKVRAVDWNNEFDRRVRIQEEVDLYGAGGGFTVRLPVNAVYDASWSSDTLFSPTRQAIYNKVEQLAPLSSPVFTGTPTSTTPLTSDNSTRIATTAYVKSNIGAQAPLASPAFTGVPTAPTPLTSDNSTTLATTAYVKSNLTSYAPLVSPVFTGTPTAPTVATADNSTSIATTAHVKANLTTYAPLASPTFTGTPLAPTQVLGESSTRLATTQFVQRRSRPLLIASRITSAPAMAISVENPIVWNNAIKDTDSILNTTNGVITLPRIGYYDIRCIAYYNGTAAFGSLSIIDGTTLTRLIRIDFRGNIVNALPLSGSALFFCSVANTQIRLSIGDLGVAGTLTNEATVTSRNFAHVSVSYLGIDT